MGDYPNWFALSAQSNFEANLKKHAGRPDLNYLQLGVFTGDASLWLCENILTGVGSNLTDVDTWEGSKDISLYDSMDMTDVFETYKSKIASHSQKIKIEQTSTVSFLRREEPSPRFDFIYVDGDHTEVGVILDAELAWGHLKPGGIMAFDDYTWGRAFPMHLRPQQGIDLVLLRHEGEFRLLAKNQQVWIEKL